MEFDTITEIYSSFNPFEPPDPEVYVDFESVRGGWNIDREVGRKITRSKKPTCQLYSGHRGAGKTTELLRLCETLEREKFFVVYFAADEEDIEPQDTTYADILLACTRHLVQKIRLKNRNPILAWMGDRWQSLKGLAQTEITFEGLNIEQQLGQFTKLTANLRAVPDIRAQLRQEINTHTVSLVKALNEFIDIAQKELTDKRGIAIVADNLDRIAEVRDETHSNYDEIYLNRSEQLRGIGAHVIYTVPRVNAPKLNGILC